MEFSLEIPDHLEDIFNKLLLKDKHQLEIINKKIIQILLNPYLFKPLRGEMKGARRVHVAKSFVLVMKLMKIIKL